MSDKPKIKFHTILHAVSPEEHAAARALRAEGFYVAFANPDDKLRFNHPFKGWISHDLNSYKDLLPKEEKPEEDSEVSEEKPKRVRRTRKKVEEPAEESTNDDLLGE